MAEFQFRLQRVLEYRQLAEGWAKDAYLEARSARLDALDGLDRIELHRGGLLRSPVKTVDDRLAMQSFLNKLEDDERHQRIVIGELEQDEAKRKTEWTERRRDVQALEKLRDKAHAEWQVEANRQEQKELDDWTTTRRAA